MASPAAKQELYDALARVSYSLHCAAAYAQDTRQAGTAEDLEQLHTELLRIRGSIWPVGNRSPASRSNATPPVVQLFRLPGA